MCEEFDGLANGLAESRMPREGKPVSGRWFVAAIGAVSLAGGLVAQAASPPVVTNVVAAQQPGTKLVSIQYTISDPDSSNANVYIKVSKDSGATWTVPAFTFTGAYGTNIPVTATPTVKNAVWNAGADWDGNYTTTCRVRVIANDAGMVLIPAGFYYRGNKADPDITNAPQTSVYVSAFLIDQTPVTDAEWDLVYEAYAQPHGYYFDTTYYTGDTFPAQGIDWFDAVKWCNARSEMEGAAPVYYTDAAFTTVYRSGQTAPYVNPAANGYRLPTEAEWEKAARGGNTFRFPWGDTINHSQASYYSPDTNKYTPLPYDLGPFPSSFGITYVGSFPANAYGLFDSAGLTWEWCWDWYAPNYYSSQPGPDPQGPASGSNRVTRGGSAYNYASSARCAFRGNNLPGASYSHGDGDLLNQPAPQGFRCVRSL
jgi:formylglycine-generating enzyme required for sulfatase activity